MTPETIVLQTKLEILSEATIGLALIFGMLKLYFFFQNAETNKKARPYFLYGGLLCVAALGGFAFFLLK